MADNDTKAERVNPATVFAGADRGPRPAGPAVSPAPAASSAMEHEVRMHPASPGGMPPLAAFLSDGDAHRLRDLLAFAMAVEAGRPIAPNAIDGLRRDADAALEGYAFRSLHNRVEEIRLAAVQEHIGRLRAPPGFLTLVVANITALVLLAGGAVLAWRYHGPALLAWLGA